MEPPLLLNLTVGLIAWSLFTLAASVAGLYFAPKSNIERWRAFWFMSAIWGLIDGIIGWFNLIGAPTTLESLRNILAINSGLDVVYVVAGTILLTRKKPFLKGFGSAILVQGLFLLTFDVVILYLCNQA